MFSSSKHCLPANVPARLSLAPANQRFHSSNSSTLLLPLWWCLIGNLFPSLLLKCWQLCSILTPALGELTHHSLILPNVSSVQMALLSCRPQIQHLLNKTHHSPPQTCFPTYLSQWMGSLDPSKSSSPPPLPQSQSITNFFYLLSLEWASPHCHCCSARIGLVSSSLDCWNSP